MSDKRSLPIGLFDSGVGGLTVLAALLRRLPNEHFLFLGDTARLPYGTKGRDTIIRYTLKAARKLVECGDLKMIVVACNTATSAALPSLREALPGIRVEGVVEPGARAAVQATENGRIAVLATEATVRGGAYARAISRLRPDVRVTSIPCTLFVPLAEEGWAEGDVAEAAARRYVGDLFAGEGSPDTMLLGCTHFPLLRPALRHVVGEGVHIVDSARTTAEAVERYLDANDLRNPGTVPGTVHLMATDNAARFARTGSLFLGRELGEGDVEIVDL